MNETTLVKGISAIGSMDGPTSVFLAGKLSVGVFAAVIAIGILIGFFGLKLVKVVAAFLGFLIGAGVGAGICALAGIEGIASVAVILVCAILLAVVSFLVYRLGVFVMIFICSMGVLAAVIPAQVQVITIVELAVALYACDSCCNICRADDHCNYRYSRWISCRSGDSRPCWNYRSVMVKICSRCSSCICRTYDSVYDAVK